MELPTFPSQTESKSKTLLERLPQKWKRRFSALGILALIVLVNAYGFGSLMLFSMHRASPFPTSQFSMSVNFNRKIALGESSIIKISLQNFSNSNVDEVEFMIDNVLFDGVVLDSTDPKLTKDEKPIFLLFDLVEREGLGEIARLLNLNPSRKLSFVGPIAGSSKEYSLQVIGIKSGEYPSTIKANVKRGWYYERYQICTEDIEILVIPRP